MLSPAGAGLRLFCNALYPGLADSPWATCCRPLARACGCFSALYPGFADSPWATCCRPLAQACGCFATRFTQGSRTRPGLHAVARWRGLAVVSARFTQGSRTRPGLHAVARWRGLAVVLQRALPRARGLALGYMLSPAGAGLRLFCNALYPGLADSPWATCCRPLARARLVRSPALGLL